MVNLVIADECAVMAFPKEQGLLRQGGADIGTIGIVVEELGHLKTRIAQLAPVVRENDSKSGRPPPGLLTTSALCDASGCTRHR